MITGSDVRRFTLFTMVLMLSMGVFSVKNDALASPPAQMSSEPETGFAKPALDAVPVLPSYDSGWYVLGPRPDPILIIFNHNLGGDPDEYRVSLDCIDNTTLGMYDCTNLGFNTNAFWYALTATSISVWVQSGTVPDEVRVRIYTTAPDYDSGWQVLLPRPDPIVLLLNHNLGGDPNNYWVSLECKDNTTLGFYSCTGLNFTVNAFWYALNATSINVWVQSSPLPDEVRVRLYHVDPEYDSGWHTIGARPDPIQILFTHNLRGDPGGYLLDLQCKDDSSLATYSCDDFNFNPNALWYALTDTSVSIWVPGASRPDEVRMRILAPDNVYLPLIMKD